MNCEKRINIYLYSEKEIEDFLKKAEQSDAKAQRTLGHCYLYGHSVIENYDKAVYWCAKSAEQGDASGQVIVSLCYFRGDGGVNNDYVKAAQ
jgi:TPR repeat protein